MLQQKNNVKYESAEPYSQVVHSSGLLPESAASAAEGPTSASSARPESSEVQIQPPPELPQPQQIRRRITGNQAPLEFEINMINSLQQGIFEINEKSVNSDQEEVDKISDFKNGIKVIFKANQRRKSRKPSRKSSFHPAVQVMKYLVSVPHPIPLIQYLASYCQEKIKQR